MKILLLPAILYGALAPAAAAQPSPPIFPLAGDWQGVLQFQGAAHHLLLHMNTTPEGKMTALLDDTDHNVEGDPAIGGSFDGTHLTLRFFYWKPNATGDFVEYKASYQATVSASGAGMTGVWTQDGAWPLNFRRLTWQARNPRPAPPTLVDGDWAGIEQEARGIQIHFILHLSNTEDGLVVLLDCPEEQFKGARASKVTWDPDSRQLSFSIFPSTWSGKLTPDGNALDISMTEPGFHFLIHFDRLPAKKTQPT